MTKSFFFLSRKKIGWLFGENKKSNNRAIKWLTTFRTLSENIFLICLGLVLTQFATKNDFHINNKRMKNLHKPDFFTMTYTYTKLTHRWHGQYLLIVLLHGDARLCNLYCPAPIKKPTILYQEGDKTSEEWTNFCQKIENNEKVQRGGWTTSRKFKPILNLVKLTLARMCRKIAQI